MTSPLYSYLMQVQRLVGFDETQAYFSIDDLHDFVNTARGEVAAQGQCVRLLTPCAGAIVTLTVVEPGFGYTNPKLSITAPDAPSGSLPYPQGSQATGMVQQIAGGIVSGSITFGGAGYFQPVATVSDPTGVGAVVTAQVAPINQAVFGQEEYSFSGIDLSPFPGIGAILSVRSVSMVWSNWQWSCSKLSFSKYQAMI